MERPPVRAPGPAAESRRRPWLFQVQTEEDALGALRICWRGFYTIAVIQVALLVTTPGTTFEVRYLELAYDLLLLVGLTRFVQVRSSRTAATVLLVYAVLSFLLIVAGASDVPLLGVEYRSSHVVLAPVVLYLAALGTLGAWQHHKLRASVTVWRNVIRLSLVTLAYHATTMFAVVAAAVAFPDVKAILPADMPEAEQDEIVGLVGFFLATVIAMAAAFGALPGTRRLYTTERAAKAPSSVPARALEADGGAELPATVTAGDRPTPAPRHNFIRAHWRGEHSLARSFWINSFLIGFLLALIAHTSMAPIADAGLGVGASFAIFGVFFVVSLLVWVWQVVGLWRSASRTWMESGRLFWPVLVKLLVILGVISGTYSFVTLAKDMVNLAGALQDPSLADYAIEVVGDTDVILIGALNHDSVNAVMERLEDPAVTLLRIDSHGGLLDPAIRLGRYIKENEIQVLAEDECVSACVLVLAASPYGSIFAHTEVTFHRAEPVIEWTNPEMRKEDSRYMADLRQAFEEFGVATWGIGLASHSEFWTPTLGQLVRMNLVDYVYDLERETFIPAEDYCALHPDVCS